jgi:streptogrisin D
MNTKSTMRRTAIVLAAGAAAIGFLAPTVAGATTVEGYSAQVQRAAVTAVAETEGVTETAAARVLRAQIAGADTLEQLSTTLGEQQAGGYLDAQGNPVVTVVDPAAAQQVRRAGATPQLVEHSTADLESARRTLENAPAVAHTAIGTDVDSNQVVLTVADAAQGPELDRLLATAADLGDAVRVEHVGGSMTKAIYNGEAITGGGSRCSAGFNTNRGGVNYILDAGHCTGAVSQWNVGPSVEASFPGNDYGLIRNDTGSAPGAVTLWNGSVQPITSAADASVGQRICKSGSTTQLTCGTVQATNVTVRYAEGAVHGLVQTTAEVNSGDSGGCLFAGSVGIGITSGMGGGSSYFQPVVEALDAYGVSLN